MSLAEEEEEEDDEPISGGLNLTPLAVDIPLTGLSEDDQLALAVRPLPIPQEKNELPGWQVLFITALQVLNLLSLLHFLCCASPVKISSP